VTPSEVGLQIGGKEQFHVAGTDAHGNSAPVTPTWTATGGTITQDGLLPASTFQRLWALQAAGVAAVVVTGRPAGWCDHIARMWPVAGVIGENGALVYRYDRASRRMSRTYLLSERQRQEGRRRLERIRRRVLQEVPACGIAADQPFRLTDLAVDYREDVGPLRPEELQAICRIIESEGATYKVAPEALAELEGD
jgi:hypothetical protein